MAVNKTSVATSRSPRKSPSGSKLSTAPKTTTRAKSAKPKVEAAKGARAVNRVTHDQIAERAWEIWQRSGCPEGRDLEHWLAAESELLRRSS